MKGFLIRGACLKEAIIIAGSLVRHKVPYFFETTNPYISLINPHSSAENLEELDLTKLTSQSIYDILKDTDSKKFFISGIDPEKIPRNEILSAYLYHKIGPLQENMDFLGYFPQSKPLENIILVDNDILKDFVYKELKVISSSNMLEDVINLNPRYIIGKPNTDEMYVTYGRMVFLAQSHISPFYFYTGGAVDRNWSNLYYYSNEKELELAFDAVNLRIKYKNNYRDMIKSTLNGGVENELM